MQLYKYHFPASGNMDPYNASQFMDMLEEKLKDGPDCLMAYCIFPSDSSILDHVELNMDPHGNVSGIDLCTYTELWDGMEQDLKNCMEENLASTLEEYETAADISLTGDVKAYGREGEVPTTLYHITERKNLESIQKNGLIPDIGNNNYKNMDNYVYLAEKKDLAPWLAVLKNMDDPVILKVDTKNLNGFESGRMFHDREFTGPDGYGEWRTAERIPSSVIQEAKLTDSFKSDLIFDVAKQIAYTLDESEKSETFTAAMRLRDMGILDEKVYEDMLVQFGPQVSQEVQNIPTGDERKTLPWDEPAAASEAEEEEGLPWDENDFGRAVEAISISDSMKL